MLHRINHREIDSRLTGWLNHRKRLQGDFSKKNCFYLNRPVVFVAFPVLSVLFRDLLTTKVYSLFPGFSFLYLCCCCCCCCCCLFLFFFLLIFFNLATKFCSVFLFYPLDWRTYLAQKKLNHGSLYKQEKVFDTTVTLALGRIMRL